MADSFDDTYQAISKPADTYIEVKEPKRKLAYDPLLLLKDRHTYRIEKVNNLEARNSMIKLNSVIYQKLFNEGQDADVYYEQAANLTVYYDSKFLWRKITAHKTFRVHVVQGSEGSVNSPDGYMGDDFISTIRVSAKVFTDLQLYLTNSKALISLLPKPRNFWLGAIFKHPKQEVNLGWIFAYISVAVSVIFYVISLIGEAYHWADNLRALIDGLF